MCPLYSVSSTPPMMSINPTHMIPENISTSARIVSILFPPYRLVEYDDRHSTQCIPEQYQQRIFTQHIACEHVVYIGYAVLKSRKDECRYRNEYACQSAVFFQISTATYMHTSHINARAIVS